MPTEADTCRTLITPKLQAAGWEDDPHSITEQHTFTDGRIIVHGGTARRRPGKRADYIRRYTRDFPIAVVEAKSEHEPGATGLQQAKDYAEILKFQFAYATNGIEIIESTGTGKTAVAFQICWKLWSSRWNRTLSPGALSEQRRIVADLDALLPATLDRAFKGEL